MVVIVFSAMVLNWEEDIERLMKESEDDVQSGVYIIAYEAFGKRSEMVSY